MNENQNTHPFEKNLKKIIETFYKAEKNKKENDIKYISWIKTICSPNFNLISNISSYINEKKLNHEIRENLFKMIKKLILFENKNIINQLNENETLLNYFMKYFINHNVNKISENFIFIFCKILKKKIFDKMINENIIKKLFLCLEIINNEELIYIVVWKLIKINFYFNKENKENIFIKIFNEILFKRVFIELILNILNQEIIYDKKIYKIILCLYNILESNNDFIFYTNDFEIFIDIFIKEIEITSDIEIKFYFLKIFHKISSNFPLNNNKLYRKEEILNLLNELNDKYKNNENKLNIPINDILNNLNS
jgi:hypothetical protein